MNKNKKSNTVLAREAKTEAFLNDLKNHCKEGKRFLFGVKANEHGISTRVYKEIRENYVAETSTPKVFKWKTRKGPKSLSVILAAPRVNAIKSTVVPSVVKLETPTPGTKLETTPVLQTTMEFPTSEANKIHKKLSGKCEVIVSVTEKRGRETTTKSYMVDGSKFMFEDVNKSIQSFKSDVQ